MDAKLILNALQIAVAAPWLYKVSNEPELSPYFSIGLKLIAGTLVAVNVPPLYAAAKREAADVAGYARSLRGGPFRRSERVIDAEAVEVVY